MSFYLRMSRIPDYTHNVSLRISQVMDEIGVNEKIVMKRRRLTLLCESLGTLTHQLMDRDTNVYIFGSQIEGTTTPRLNSDTDLLLTVNKYNVIQDWSEWEHGKHNLLMIQDETVSPGYCLLQELRDDAPLPAVVELNEHSYRDGVGRILLNNNCFNFLSNRRCIRNGPAHSVSQPGMNDSDTVPSYPCHTFPAQATQWLDQHREGG